MWAPHPSEGEETAHDLMAQRRRRSGWASVGSKLAISVGVAFLF